MSVRKNSVSIATSYVVHKQNYSSTFKINFSPVINSKITIGFFSEKLNIEIEAEGETYNSIDTGIALFLKNGSSFYNFNIFTIPNKLSRSFRNDLLEFIYLQVGVLKVCTESKRAVQMFSSNKLMLWILVHHIYVNSIDLYRINWYLGLKKRALVKELLNTDSPGVFKFISKISLLSGEKNELELVSRVAKKPDIVNAFKYWKVIPIQALYISERFPNLAAVQFLQEWCNPTKERMSEYLLGINDLNRLTIDTIQLGVSLNIKTAKNIVCACDTKDKLKSLHDRWVALLLKSQKALSPDLNFPAHKIQVTKGIEWVSTANRLIKEGIEMEHCIATYIDKALSGKSIIFAIYDPERATLEVRKRNGSFFRSEIKLKRNQNVSNRTLNFVNNWLLQENKNISEK